MKGVWGLSLLPLLAAASPVSVESIHNNAAPVLTSVNSKEVPDSYIVVFKDHVSHDTASAHQSWVQDIHSAQTERIELKKRSLFGFSDPDYMGMKHAFNVGDKFKGYAGHFHEDVIEQVRRHPDVEYVELDSEVHTMSEPEVEKSAPWGLARISHRDGLSFGTFNKYFYATEGGEGVDAYTIDTGINIEHVDFEGRAHWGKTIPSGDADEDGNGHGTHCSGTIAGKKYGVAKKANVHAVKVLRSSGSGTMSDVVKGVEWAVEAHVKKVKAAKEGKAKGFKGSVANMSLGGGKSPTLELAVNAGVEAGVHFAVAAGNENSDACDSSPAAADKPITVGASTLSDERAYFSNYGKCTDIFAPGLNILSTWTGSKHAVNTISGTSMASPHICGLLAYFVSLQPAKDSAFAVADLTPEKLKKDIIHIATKDALSDIPSDTPNLLAWNGGGSNNYSEIVAKGGKTVGAANSKDDLSLDEVVHKAEEVSEELSAIYSHIKDALAA